MQSNTQRRIILQYYILSAMFSGIGSNLVCATYTTFLIKKGLNLLEVNMVNTAFFITLFLCEIPTGAFADVFGRKRSLIVSFGIAAIGMFIYAVSETFWHFVFAEIVLGFGLTFQSGAFQSWLVDSLKHAGYEGSPTRIFAREFVFDKIATGIGSIAGAYAAIASPTLPWWLGGGGLLITMVTTCFLIKEEYFAPIQRSVTDHIREVWKSAIECIHYGVSDSRVRFILTTTSIQMFAVMAFNMFWQPFAQKNDLLEQHFGYLFIAMMICLGIGSAIVSHIHTEGREKRLILISQIITGAIIICASVAYQGKLAIGIFLTHEISRGMWGPLQDGYLHKEIPTRLRASILSFCEVLPKICGALGLMVSGAVAKQFGVGAAWILSGSVLIVGAILVIGNGKRKKK
jgi:MFS family permease